jgi:phosphoserine aminotransferase
MCDNETIQGIEFSDLPDVSAPLVIDMSSNFLSKPITQWNKIGLVLACAQKNFGISGVTVVIVRKSLLERPLKPFCPITLDYRTQVKNGCLYNTPPSFAIYFAGLEFKWIEEIGGVEYLEKRNKSRAKKLYKAIDESDLFVNVVKPQFRSSMNVPFYRKEGLLYKNDSLDLQFLDFLAERNIVNIGGHATVGGFRASIYNAVSDDAIDALIKAIQEFPGFNIIE